MANIGIPAVRGQAVAMYIDMQRLKSGRQRFRNTPLDSREL